MVKFYKCSQCILHLPILTLFFLPHNRGKIKIYLIRRVAVQDCPINKELPLPKRSNRKASMIVGKVENQALYISIFTTKRSKRISHSIRLALAKWRPNSLHFFKHACDGCLEVKTPVSLSRNCSSMDYEIDWKWLESLFQYASDLASLNPSRIAHSSTELFVLFPVFAAKAPTNCPCKLTVPIPVSFVSKLAEPSVFNLNCVQWWLPSYVSHWFVNVSMGIIEVSVNTFFFFLTTQSYYFDLNPFLPDLYRENHAGGLAVFPKGRKDLIQP